MREILFRGKRIDNGEWAIGDIRFIGTRIEIGGGYISNEVDPKTVGQFTGLLDKNGKKIFEGDVVRCVDETNNIEFVAAVEFGNPNYTESWGYQFKRISGDKPNLDILLWTETELPHVYCEAIGNIHDNPELLHKS